MTQHSFPLIDAGEIKRAVSALIAPGAVFEVRIPKGSTVTDRKSAVYSGYFEADDAGISKLIAGLRQLAAFESVYITAQVVDPQLLGRADSRIKKSEGGDTTSDCNILSYRNLLIDCDPVRPGKLSSQGKAHQAAIDRAYAIRDYLSGTGFPSPIVGDSGNGAHLIYRIDLPNDEDINRAETGLFHRFLKSLDAQFSDSQVAVDLKMFNPSRIWKLYGTRACKGDHCPKIDAPWRMSAILELPEDIEEVPRFLLERIASPVEVAPAKNVKKSVSSSVVNTGHIPSLQSNIDYMERFIGKYNIQVKSSGSYRHGFRWVLDHCAFNEDHRASDACLYAYPDGFGYACSHNSCSKNHWQEFKRIFEPTQQSAQIHPAELVSDLAGFDADDNGNGDCMHYMYGDQFLYCAERGWMTYNGKNWDLDSDGAQVNKCIADCLKQRRLAAVEAEKEAVVKCTVGNLNRMTGCAARFRSLVGASIASFDVDPNLLNCANGVVDLRDGSIVPHNHQQRFTYCVPVDYNPDADTSVWTEYLKSVVGGGDAMIDYLQLALGYSITGHTSEESLFYLYGPSRAGKGTLAEVYSNLLPYPLSNSVDFNSFCCKRDGDNSNFDLAPMKPSRMIFASESNKSQSLNPAKLKQLTGGDMITCCFKHKDHFSYKPKFKIWMMSNHQVNGDPDDPALWGRIKIIDFPNSYLGHEDKSKKARLTQPDILEGVLAWTISGSIRWANLGLSGMPEPKPVSEAKERHRSDLDYVEQWLNECADLTQGGWTSNEELLRSYTSWATSNGVGEPKKMKGLTQSLQAKGMVKDVRKIMGKTERGFWNVYITS